MICIVGVLQHEGDLPPSATERFLEERGRSLKFAAAVELGLLAPGHQVWLTGIEDHDGSLVLHYELVPAARGQEIAQAGGGRFHWQLEVQDDLGNLYQGAGVGSLDVESTHRSSHGQRDIGVVNPEASKLFLRFKPARAASPLSVHEALATFDLRTSDLSFGT